MMACWARPERHFDITLGDMAPVTTNSRILVVLVYLLVKSISVICHRGWPGRGGIRAVRGGRKLPRSN
jgi:hypothetical protein